MKWFSRLRPLLAFLAIAMMLVVAAGQADARIGGGFSSGSRGMRSFTPPPATNTAPNTARPLERSLAQPSPTLPGSAFPGGFGGFGGGFFGRGMFGGLAAGFLGAGLFGMLFGHGMFGGLGGFASMLGLLLQIGLVVILARFIWGWLQRRNMPAFASGPMARGLAPDLHSVPGGAGPMAGGASIAISPQDFDTFEKLLGDIQGAYSAEDLNALRQHVTPEMLSYFSQDLAANTSRGVVNRVSGVKLLQGDLAEAWREGDVDYATVAMRFSLIDQVIERASGRILEGDANHPVEVTELWTFMRAGRGNWLLSAIQQAN